MISGVFLQKPIWNVWMHIYIMKLNMVVNDMKAKGLSPIYLVTDHIGFYEKYGWEFLCMVPMVSLI